MLQEVNITVCYDVDFDTILYVTRDLYYCMLQFRFSYDFVKIYCMLRCRFSYDFVKILYVMRD